MFSYKKTLYYTPLVLVLPIAIRRSGWKGRGALFSDTGVSIRCVREDQTSRNNVLHFVTDGTAKLMFSYKKTLYYTPLVLVLKCLVKHTDYYMCQQLLGPYEDDAYYTE
jgi:DNA-directed RNA polymerase I subunit RPA2